MSSESAVEIARYSVYTRPRRGIVENSRAESETKPTRKVSSLREARHKFPPRDTTSERRDSAPLFAINFRPAFSGGFTLGASQSITRECDFRIQGATTFVITLLALFNRS